MSNRSLVVCAGMLLAVVCCLSQVAEAAEKASAYWVYVGTYTGGKSKGIQLFRFDPATGALTAAGLAAEVTNPSYLTVAPGNRFVYAISEMESFRGQRSGAVSAFSVDAASGKLTMLNQQPSGGRGPCYVTVDGSGKNALVANYSGGTVAVLPIGGDGKLAAPACIDQHKGKGPNPQRQEGPHAHCVDLDPTGKFALSCDLGLDKLMMYRFEPAKSTITANDPAFATVAPGAGPRHMAFDPSGKHLYVINEMGNTITAFNWDSDRGAASEMQVISTLSADFTGSNTTAEIMVHPSGKFVYGSNRGHNSIAIFSIDGDGKLKATGWQSSQGKTPRMFSIDPTGNWLLAANQDSNNVVVYRINLETGALTPAGQVEVPLPVCVKFVPVAQ